MYKGIAKLDDGSTIETSGTIAEIANWADNLIREQAGEIQIDIRLID